MESSYLLCSESVYDAGYIQEIKVLGQIPMNNDDNNNSNNSKKNKNGKNNH